MAELKLQVWKMHVDVGQLAPLTDRYPWAMPVNGLTHNGMQVYRIIGREGFYRRGGYDPDLVAYLVDEDLISDLSEASEQFLQRALEEAAQNQVREE